MCAWSIDFDEEGLAGAALDTTVRARENLIIGIGDPSPGSAPALTGSEPVTAHICLVSKVASRFGARDDPDERTSAFSSFLPH
jgi:hypothetical protein